MEKPAKLQALVSEAVKDPKASTLIFAETKRKVDEIHYMLSQAGYV